MRKSFFEYMMLKEGSGSGESGSNNKAQPGEMRGLPSEIKLSDDGEFKPFVVGEEGHHPNLSKLVSAFLDSQKIPFPGPDGYPGKLTTLDGTKGETTPKLKKKTLYATGGLARDHARGKTPQNYNLATDATPDEIRLILRAAGFTEIKPEGKKGMPIDNKKYGKLPEGGSKNNVFWIDKHDRGGKEYGVKVKINGENFDIETLRKGSKNNEKVEFGSLEDDAARRDFTFNSMYIPLTSADGPNSKMVDPYGGAHHLRSGDVRFIGNPKDKLDGDEDSQLRALRFVRFASGNGANNAIPDEYKSAISDMSDMPGVGRERMRDEFLKGMEHPDVDTRKYIKMMHDLGLLGTMFPRMNFKMDDPKKDLTDKKDKRLVVAHLLRNNNPEDVKKMFSDKVAGAGWQPNEVNDILHLIKMNGWASKKGKDDDGFFNDFYDMKNDHAKTSLIPSVLKQWGKMNNIDDEVVNNYTGHDLSHKAYEKDGFGNRVVNKKLSDLFGRPPQGKEFDHGIRHLETGDFKNRFKKNKEKSQEEPQS
jgi:tRNA nucleotidyltransferase/poly(A) polymerase